MGFKDILHKIRVFFEGDADDEQQEEELYSSDRSREDRAERRAKNGPSLAEMVAGDYDDPQDDDGYDDDEYYDDSDVDDEYYDDSDADDEYAYDYDDDYSAPQASYERFAPPQHERVAPAPERAEFSPVAVDMPLPNRTEVTLQQIERLSKQLDDASMKEYQRRLVEYRSQKGAVSALTALRILQEFVSDDTTYGDGRDYPDLSAK